MLIKYITDNQGRTADRWRVNFWDNTYLSLSEDCDMPNGFSQWGHNTQYTNSDLMVAAMTDECLQVDDGIVKFVNYFDLPANVQQHLRSRMQEK